MVGTRFSAQEAAQRYAEDETFAEEFEAELANLYRQQLEKLERIALRSGVAAQAQELPLTRTGFTAGPAAPKESFVAPDKVREVLEKSGSRSGLTRGQIAKAIGVDSRDPGLTRALKLLKEQAVLVQQGERRAARYSIELAPRRRRGGSRRS